MKLLYEPCKMNCFNSQARTEISMATRDAEPSSPHCNRKAHKNLLLWLVNSSKPHEMVNNLSYTVFCNNRCWIEHTESNSYNCKNNFHKYRKPCN